MNEDTRKLMFSSESEEWTTPQWLFTELNNEFGQFHLDAAATYDNRKCTLFISKQYDALSQPWKRFEDPNIVTNVFVNPPYSRQVGKWVKKASDESAKGCRVVMLLPARTDTKWFHQFIYKKPRVEIRFLEGRVKFGNATSGAPFPSMVVIFEEHKNDL